MRFLHTHGFSAFSSALLCATLLGVAGCGRTPVGAVGADDKPPVSASPSPGDPATDPGAAPGDPGTPGANPAPAGNGGGAAPAPDPNGPAPAPGPAARGGGLSPLTPAAPIATKGGPAAPAPADVANQFLGMMKHFGYLDAGVTPDELYRDIHLQLVPLTRVPAERFVAPQPAPQPNGTSHSPAFLAHGRACPEFATVNWADDGAVAAAEQRWSVNAVNLARRNTGVSFYASSRSLYRSVIVQPYITDQDGGSGGQTLVLYKRLNRTGYAVGYTPDGKIFDFGFFPTQFNDQRYFLPVPDLYTK